MSIVKVLSNGRQKYNCGWCSEIHTKYGTSVKIRLTEDELKELYSLLKMNYKGDGKEIELWLSKRRTSRPNHPTHDLTMYIPENHALALKGEEYLKSKKQSEDRKARAQMFSEGNSEPKYTHATDPFE